MRPTRVLPESVSPCLIFGADKGYNYEDIRTVTANVCMPRMYGMGGSQRFHADFTEGNAGVNATYNRLPLQTKEQWTECQAIETVELKPWRNGLPRVKCGGNWDEHSDRPLSFVAGLCGAGAG